MDMTIQRVEQFRSGERSALIKHGVALWTRTERHLGIMPFDAPLPPNKIN